MSWPTYGGRVYPRQKAALPVYEANESDWDEDGNFVGERGGEEDDGGWEGEDGEQLDPDEHPNEGGHGQWETVKTIKPNARVLHPTLFGPPTDPPRTLLQKQMHAPLWYGPPGSEAETSVAGAKRLSGSPPSEPAPKRRRRGGVARRLRKQQEAAELLVVRPPNSPAYRPQSPTQQRALSPLAADGVSPHPVRSSASSASSDTPDFIPSTVPHTVSLPKKVGPYLPALGQALPSALSGAAIPRDFPPPPPIVPLTGEEEPLPRESPEELLKQALWSWYAAGYQTGLYHAAVGVAGANAGAGAKGDANGAEQSAQEEMQLSE